VPGKPEYNLSYETLTSRATRKALRTYLKEDKIFAEEIKARLGSSTLPDIPDDLPTTGGLQEEDLDSDIEGDDSDVALADVIRDALGDGLPTPDRSVLEVASATQDEDTGALTAGTEDDNIWAYNDHGQKWSEVGISSEEMGSQEDEDAQDD
jgi:hypothetical protein